METTIKFVGLRRTVGDINRATKFYSDILGLSPTESKDGEKSFRRPGWELRLVAGALGGFTSGWLTFAVPSLSEACAKLTSMGVRYSELIPPWLEEGARLARFFDPDGLMLQCEESQGPTGGRDDIVVGVTDVTKAVRAYSRGFSLEVIRSYNMFAELSTQNGPVLCLIKVEKVLGSAGILLFQGSKIKDTTSLLENSGFSILGYPVKADGGKILKVRDPFGNPIEVTIT